MVGGGKVAARKAGSLYRCGAVLTVVAPATVEQLDSLVRYSMELGVSGEDNAGRDNAIQDGTGKDSIARNGPVSGPGPAAATMPQPVQDDATRDGPASDPGVAQASAPVPWSHDPPRKTSEPVFHQAIKLERREYQAGEAARYKLVVAATGNSDIDRLVAQDAAQAGALVNVADDARPSNMLFPAVCRDGPVSVSVSTEGASPALASWLRNELQRILPDGLSILAGLLEEARCALHAANLSTEGIDWHDLIDGRKSGSPGLLALLNAPSSGVAAPDAYANSLERSRTEEARSYISNYIAGHGTKLAFEHNQE